MSAELIPVFWFMADDIVPAMIKTEKTSAKTRNSDVILRQQTVATTSVQAMTEIR